MDDKLHVTFGSLPEFCIVQNIFQYNGRSRVVCHSVGSQFFELDFIILNPCNLLQNDALIVTFKDASCSIVDCSIKQIEFIDFSVSKRSFH